MNEENATTETLFETGEPVAASRIAAPDFFNLYAVEKLGAPEGWRWVTLEVVKSDGPKDFRRMEGAIYPERQWKKRDRSTVRNYIYDSREFRTWCVAYAAERGKCWNCWGSGQELASCGVSGTTYRTCHECKGTGKPQ